MQRTSHSSSPAVFSRPFVSLSLIVLVAVSQRFSLNLKFCFFFLRVVPLLIRAFCLWLWLFIAISIPCLLCFSYPPLQYWFPCRVSFRLCTAAIFWLLWRFLFNMPLDVPRAYVRAVSLGGSHKPWLLGENEHRRENDEEIADTWRRLIPIILGT